MDAVDRGQRKQKEKEVGSCMPHATKSHDRQEKTVLLRENKSGTALALLMHLISLLSPFGPPSALFYLQSLPSQCPSPSTVTRPS